MSSESGSEPSVILLLNQRTVHQASRPRAGRVVLTASAMRARVFPARMRNYVLVSVVHSSIGQVAQSVEQWTENPCVDGSIPPLTTLPHPPYRV